MRRERRRAGRGPVGAREPAFPGDKTKGDAPRAEPFELNFPHALFFKVRRVDKRLRSPVVSPRTVTKRRVKSYKVVPRGVRFQTAPVKADGAFK